MEEDNKYFCAFNRERLCPVRTEYKLKPESLIEFCKVCPSFPSKQSQTLQWGLIAEITKQTIIEVSSIVKEGNKLQRELGEFKAKAELYQKLYEELKQ